jgi:HEAT repeat protein
MATDNNEQADRIIKALLSGDKDDGSMGNELLNYFFRGVPVAKIKALLLCNDPEVAGESAWVLSELGARGQSVMRECKGLLSHPSSQVRRHFIETILSAATTEDGPLILEAIGHAEDVSGAVRWKVIFFLVRIDAERLRAAIASDPARESPWRTKLELLAGNPSTEEIKAMIADLDMTVRTIGIAAAYRIRSSEPDALKYALNSDDALVREFAETALNRTQSAGRKA